MEQQEAVASAYGPVTLVKLCNALCCSGEESLVALEVLGHSVDPVGEQCEIKVAFRAGEVMDLQPLYLLLDKLLCCQ